MKKILILILISLASCNENKVMEGEMYITMINIYNPQVLGTKQKIKDFKDQLENGEEGFKIEKPLLDYYKILIENDLFEKNTFQIKLKNDEIINVYVDEIQYEKLKLENFNKEKELLKIKIKGIKISEGAYGRAIYSASEIVSVEKRNGKTEWSK